MIFFLGFNIFACFIESYSNLYIVRDWNAIIKRSDCSKEVQRKFINAVVDKKGQLKKSYLETLLDGEVIVTPSVINVGNLENYLTSICKMNFKVNDLKIDTEVVGNNFNCTVNSELLILRDGERTVRISYQRKKGTNVLVYRQDLVRGDRIGENIECRSTEVKDGRYFPCNKKEELKFCKMVRSKKKEEVVSFNDCVATNIIERNQKVDILLRKNGLNLQTTGKALKTARWGEMVSVQRDNKVVLNGVAQGEGKVLVQL